MIDMYSKYDKVQNNEIFYVLISINNHTIASINCILSCIPTNHRSIVGFETSSTLPLKYDNEVCMPHILEVISCMMRLLSKFGTHMVVVGSHKS